MKQLFQNLSNGNMVLNDIPMPSIEDGTILIKSSNSVISSGTERMLHEFGKSNLIKKAKNQPHKVRQVIDKAKSDGILETYTAVKTKLDQVMPLGYSNAGVVIESRSSDFSVGDRVVSNGAHAEVVRVPSNLCAKIPPEVDSATAAFTVLASIGLQGVRLMHPQLGENIVVYGLGLIGNLVCQILKANGCNVIGIDINKERCDIAAKMSIQVINSDENNDIINRVKSLSNENGVDGVIITASSKDNSIISNAAQFTRKNGRIILTGDVGLNINREDFYKKEISFKVSSSYGHGRYDNTYEDKGLDYPFAFVRWTVRRNFEAVLNLMKNKSINVDNIITDYFDISDYKIAYKKISQKVGLATVFNYPNKIEEFENKNNESYIENEKAKFNNDNPIIAVLGAGNFSSRVILPNLFKLKSNLHTLVSSTGLNASHYGKKFKFHKISTNIDNVLDDNSINTVFIATRHNLHADQICKILKKGKNVFVEKPLAISEDQIDQIKDQHAISEKKFDKKIHLMVGYNRRFSPHIKRIKLLLKNIKKPKSIIFTINAGSIDRDHWLNDEMVGGGRLIGEACHFIDLLSFLLDSKIKNFNVVKLNDTNSLNDTFTITLSFLDGSLGTINYFSNGSKLFSKERIEVFCENKILQLNNFKKLVGFDWPNFNKMNLFYQDKGHLNCYKEFLESIKYGSETPINIDEIFNISKIILKINEQIKKN